MYPFFDLLKKRTLREREREKKKFGKIIFEKKIWKNNF